MSRCSRVNCTLKPEFECLCRNELKFFCAVDIVGHLSDNTVNHSYKDIAEVIDVNVRKVIITGLKKCISEVTIQQNQIIKDLSNCITSIEQRAKRAILELRKQKKDLEKAVKTILDSPQTLPESKLKASLNLPLDIAKQEVNQWKFTSLTLNSKEIKSSITNWVILQNNFNTLLSLSQSTESNNQVVPAPRNINPQPVNLLPNSINPASGLTLFCQRNHTLKWTITVTSKYNQTKNDFWVDCKSCLRQYACSGWHCNECNFDICEDCGISSGVASPKLKCTKNHELLWRPDANFYYKTLCRNYNFKCDECNAIKNEVHWNCRACKYDVCQACGNSNHKQQPLNCKATCKNNHSLDKIQSSSNQRGLKMDIVFKCNCCQNMASHNIYACKICNFFLCESCYSFFNSPIAGHPALRCQNRHLLRWVVVERFQCDYCFQNFTEEHYKCKECSFNVCDKCANILMMVFMQPNIRSYGPNKVPLKWIENIGMARNRGNPVSCNLCKVYFKNAGMFCSSNRQYNHCLLCYNDPQRLNPNLRNTNTDAASIIAANLLLSMLKPNS